ncbi:MAG: carbohydrate kinase family protein, partial [Candidatus Margulisiibacteriota bacterium]
RAITVFGHVCYDFSSPKIQRTGPDNAVLGIAGLEREGLMTAVQLRERHGLEIKDVAEKQGWDLFELSGSKGGPAASAALSAFQLLTEGTVDFYGMIGNDRIGDLIAAYFDSYCIDGGNLIRSEHPTSYTLVINEDLDLGKESRTFLHETGANGFAAVSDYPETCFKFNKAERNVVMVGGSFLMPGLHPNGTLDIFRKAKDQKAFTILSTVRDPSEKWELGKGASELIDLLIMDRHEACKIAGYDNNVTGSFLLNWFNGSHFRNVIITDGTNGAFMYATDPNIFAKADGFPFHVPASELIMSLDRPKYGLGCGDCAAGGFAVAVAEHMTPLQAGLFAMSAGGACALNIAGEIGEPVAQGEHRYLVNFLFNQMLRQLGMVEDRLTPAQVDSARRILQ